MLAVLMNFPSHPQHQSSFCRQSLRRPSYVLSVDISDRGVSSSPGFRRTPGIHRASCSLPAFTTPQVNTYLL
jgi:hypothetical protein